MFRNEVLELIQYAPQTDEVYEVPALVVRRRSTSSTLSTSPRNGASSNTACGRQADVRHLLAEPGLRHASWNLDTYVRAVLDALDAVEEITGSERTVLGGVCSGGILASMTAAYLAGIGRQDRLAALCLRSRHRQPRCRDGVRPGRRTAGGPGQGEVGAQGLPRRPGRWPRCSLAAARRPGVELLGQQLPARQAATGVRHPVLELRHDPDDRRPARRLHRPGDGELADPARGPHRPRRADRPRQDHWTPTWWPASPTTSPWENCYRRPTLRRHDRPCSPPVDTSPPWSTPRQPQGVLPHRRRPDVRRQGSQGLRRPPGHLVDRPRPVARRTRGAQRSAPEMLGSHRLSVLAEAPAPTSSTSDQVPPGPCPRPRRPGSRPAGHGTRPAAGALQRHRGQPRPAPAVRRPGRPTNRGRPLRRTRRGGSPIPKVPYNFAMLAGLVGTLVDRLGYDRFDALGISWGGGLAQQLAFQYPRRCRRLVLASTGTGMLMVPARLSVLSKMLTPRRYRDPAYAQAIAPVLTAAGCASGPTRSGTSCTNRSASGPGRVLPPAPRRGRLVEPPRPAAHPAANLDPRRERRPHRPAGQRADHARVAARRHAPRLRRRPPRLLTSADELGPLVSRFLTSPNSENASWSS